MIIEIFVGILILISVWPEIVDFFSTRLIPWVRTRISNSLADLIADFIVFADQVIVPVRRLVKKLWATFKQHVLGIKMEVKKISASTVAGKTTTIIQDENGKFMQSVTEEVINWDALPAAIRSEMNRQGTKEATMDLKKAAEEKFRQSAKQGGMEMELTT